MHDERGEKMIKLAIGIIAFAAVLDCLMVIGSAELERRLQARIRSESVKTGGTPEGDLIEREDVLKILSRCKDRLQGKGLTYDILVDYIEKIPAADAVPLGSRLPFSVYRAEIYESPDMVRSIAVYRRDLRETEGGE